MQQSPPIDQIPKEEQPYFQGQKRLPQSGKAALVLIIINALIFAAMLVYEDHAAGRHAVSRDNYLLIITVMLVVLLVLSICGIIFSAKSLKQPNTRRGLSIVLVVIHGVTAMLFLAIAVNIIGNQL